MEIGHNLFYWTPKCLTVSFPRFFSPGIRQPVWGECSSPPNVSPSLLIVARKRLWFSSRTTILFLYFDCAICYQYNLQAQFSKLLTAFFKVLAVTMEPVCTITAGESRTCFEQVPHSYIRRNFIDYGARTTSTPPLSIKTVIIRYIKTAGLCAKRETLRKKRNGSFRPLAELDPVRRRPTFGRKFFRSYCDTSSLGNDFLETVLIYWYTLVSWAMCSKISI